MPARVYETLFILDSTKVAADPDGTRTALHAAIEKHGGEIVVSRPWDENRKLAYPIDKHKKGFYQITYYKFESTKQADLERDFRLNEVIIRQLTSVLDAKWEDTLLDIAKNDTTTSFAHRGMQDETAPTDVTPNLGLPGEGGFEGDNGPPARGGFRGPRRDAVSDKD